MRIDISFDDGHVSDMRVAKLLTKYGFKGTFYNTNAQVARTIKMSVKEIVDTIIKAGHEIGSHTITHPMDMKECDDERLKFELENSKYGTEKMLRNVLTAPILKFCYPRGRHDERVRKAVADAGYTEARTTRVLQIRNDTGDPLQMPTTIHMFPRAEYKDVHWLTLAQEWFLKALQASQSDDTVFFHLWGHSAELDNQMDWENFELILAFMRERLSTI